MDVTINISLRFDNDTFDRAVDLYEDDWGYSYRDLTRNDAVVACMSASMDHTGDDVDEFARTLDKEDKAKLVKGFADAYCRRITQRIIDYLDEEE